MRNKIIKIENEIGKTYNFLTVVKEGNPYKTKANYWSRRWIFKCICGNEKEISPNNVFNGVIKSCGCKRRELINKGLRDYFNINHPNSIESKLYSCYKLDAIKHKREFNLTKEEFFEIVNSNCFYCGDSPSLIRYTKHKKKQKALNGVDRINSNLGYEIKNCVPCCTTCNYMKKSLDKDEFINHIYKIANFNKFKIKNNE